MDVLLIDEITHFTDVMYRFLRGRLRQVGLEIPEQFEQQYTGMFPRIMVSGNPGNIGHLWVKKAWIEGKQKGVEYQMPAREGGMKRIYIPARLDDNPSLMEADPTYEARLEGLGSKALVEALRWGNWDVVEGAFFDCWSEDKHVIPPFALPPEWPVIRSMDWGSGGQASPASIGWWAVVQDDTVLDLGLRQILGNSAFRGEQHRPSHARNGNGHRHHAEPGRGADRIVLPRGALVRFREFYGTVPGLNGGKHNAEQVARHIIALERLDEAKVEKAYDLHLDTKVPGIF
jgi:hypothetical protein